MHKLHGDRIRLSRENAFEDERWNASIKSYRRGLLKLSRLKTEKVLADIEMGDWRLDLVPNEQALHHVLVSIRDMCMERPNINDMRVPNETLML